MQRNSPDVSESSFDLFFAVFSPLIVLVYSYKNFDFERERFRMYTTLMDEGSFERQARLMADPSQVFLFLINFGELRIKTGLDFVLRIGMNLACCYRLKRIVEVRIRQRRKLLYNERERTAMAVQPLPQKSVSKAMVLPFIVAGAFVVVYTNRCIANSAAVCEAHLTCVAHAHRADNNDLCPCLVLIDVEVAPKTYAEWLNPVDVTESVKQLAASGDLNVLQLINRRLEELPEELQSCTELKHMYVCVRFSRAVLSACPTLTTWCSAAMQVADVHWHHEHPCMGKDSHQAGVPVRFDLLVCGSRASGC